MARIYMVRHGQAAARYGQSADPGLDVLGREQAAAAAEKLGPFGPLAILSSPLARARETAAPLAKLWNADIVIEPAVAEIPSPDIELAKRAEWLGKIMAGSWRTVPPPLMQWREALIEALTLRTEDTVVFSHYVALNVAFGAAVGDDRVTAFSPENCSITIFETDGSRLTLVERGAEAPLTKVN